MKNSLLAAGVVACLILSSAMPALACGDKIVDVSQGVKFQRALGMGSATILIYVDADRLERSVRRLGASLARVGHEVEVVTDWQVAMDQLREEGFDLVIAELEVLVMAEFVEGSESSPPHVIPLVLDGSDTDLQRAQDAYPFVLALPSRDNEQILTVAEALNAHEPAASTI